MSHDPIPSSLPARRPSRWSLLITIVLAATLLVIAFYGVDWHAMLTTLRGGRLDYLLLTFGILSLSFFMRAVRWRVLLSAERPLAIGTVFWATSVGYLGNSFLPARAGEVMRSALIARAGQMSVGYAFVTAMTERILDACILVTISLFALLWLDNMPEWLMIGARVTGILCIVAVLVLVLAPRIEPWLKQILRLLPLPESWHERLAQLLEQVLLGMQAFQHTGRALSFVLLSAVVWSLDTIIAIQVAQILSLSLTMPQALLLLAALGLASAAPSTPGYVGIYQFIAVTVLVPFGFSQSDALAYIITFQAVSYLVVIIWGLLGLWRLHATQPTTQPDHVVP